MEINDKKIKSINEILDTIENLVLAINVLSNISDSMHLYCGREPLNIQIESIECSIRILADKIRALLTENKELDNGDS
ncbi:MAG TPA: hypothetical protein VNU45_19810 [Rummeliibacillus sp.]|nr:hypothetical protein [Rummeliibacillus sp.]